MGVDKVLDRLLYSPYAKTPGSWFTCLPNKFLPRVGGRGSCPTYVNTSAKKKKKKKELECIL